MPRTLPRWMHLNHGRYYPVRNSVGCGGALRTSIAPCAAVSGAALIHKQADTSRPAEPRGLAGAGAGGAVGNMLTLGMFVAIYFACRRIL